MENKNKKYTDNEKCLRKRYRVEMNLYSSICSQIQKGKLFLLMLLDSVKWFQ